MIYTIKIALHRNQLSGTYDAKFLGDIYSLAIFLSVYYSRMWLQSTNTASAPKNDLDFLKLILRVSANASRNPSHWPNNFSVMAEKAALKMIGHLDYLSERLVALSLFSVGLDLSQKQALKRALNKQKRNMDSQVPQQMPYSANFRSKSLVNFVGRDSLLLFDLLGLDSSFLSLPANEWQQSSAYLTAQTVVANLPCTNDPAERVLGLATDVNCKTAPKTETELQNVYKVIKGTRKKLHELATSSEYVTKRSLGAVDYNW